MSQATESVPLDNTSEAASVSAEPMVAEAAVAEPMTAEAQTVTPLQPVAEEEEEEIEFDMEWD